MMFHGTPYAAAFRMPDGFVRWFRFRTTWTDELDIRIEAVRKYGMEPCQITDAGNGETVFRDRGARRC